MRDYGFHVMYDAVLTVVLLRVVSSAPQRYTLALSHAYCAFVAPQEGDANPSSH